MPLLEKDLVTAPPGVLISFVLLGDLSGCGSQMRACQVSFLWRRRARYDGRSLGMSRENLGYSPSIISSLSSPVIPSRLNI